MERGDQVERQVRAAKNQALFREVNERLEGLAHAFQFIARTTSFACECSDLSCIQQMSLTLGEYEDVRKSPNRFAVLPVHADPHVERVVAGNERYVIVEKIGKAAEIAREADPRAVR